jgi:hypothetical protein
VFEHTAYHVSTPHAWLTTTVAGMLMLALAVGAGALRRFGAVAALVPSAAIAFVSWHVLRSSSAAGTAGRYFADRYDAVAASGAAGAGALVFGGAGIAWLVWKARSGAPPSVAAAPMVIFPLALGAGIALLVFALRIRLALGPPAQPLPVVVKEGAWMGHTRFVHAPRASLSEPTRRSFWSPGNERAPQPTAVDEETARANGWICETCEAMLEPDRPGEVVVPVRGRAGVVRFEAKPTFTAIDESGSPLWPMRVGERHVFGLAHHAMGAEGGWGVAIAEGTGHLAPRRGMTRVERAHLVLTVTGTEMREGFRHFQLEIAEGGARRTIRVVGEGGETWLRLDSGERVPLLRSPSARTKGLFACHFAESVGLRLSTCSDGTDARAPVAGPVSGIARSENTAGQDLTRWLVAAASLGAIAPGHGAYDEYCYETAESGGGEIMRVERPPPPEPSQEPSHGSGGLPFVACPER